MPNVVKGSKQEQMVVVPYRPRQRVLFTLFLVLGIAISAAGGWAYGYYKTMLTQQTELADQSELTAEIDSLRLENANLRRQIAILDRSSVMDQQANAEVQGTITSLRERVAQLEEDIVFYRQVVAEETEDTGLMIGQLDLDATTDPGRYRYKLVMRQKDADGDTFLVGHVNVNLVGLLDEEQVILALRDISEAEDELDIRLRFKYFQNIEGELALPEGFQPDRVQIAAVSTEPVSKTISEDFGWVVATE
jgi:cell division protein FtsB